MLPLDHCMVFLEQGAASIMELSCMIVLLVALYFLLFHTDASRSEREQDDNDCDESEK